MCSFNKKQPVPYPGNEDSDCYPMNYEKKGLCYIFNHKNFNGPKLKSLEQRIGTDIDAQQLKHVFEKLGLVVDEFEDYTYEQIGQKLQIVQKMHKSEYSCFVCCILSYGRMGSLCASDWEYPAKNIYEGFFGNECTAFAGKPKIFFIQACPCDVDVSSNESTDYGGPNAGVFRIPTTSDFLVVYSTIPGNLSWNLNSNQGSWFIDALCSTIENHISEMDLLQLLNIVNHKLSEMHKSKLLAVEVPCVTSTLIRDIKLIVSDSGDAGIVKTKDLSHGSHNTKKGKVLIFNHEVYKNSYCPRRLGTDKDVKVLKDLFKGLNFEKPLYFKEKKKKFIFNKLYEVADMNHEEYDCFICCILTHGNRSTLTAYDQVYEIDDMLSCFYNKWSDKPKVFLIQACQGEKLDSGHEMVEKMTLAEIADSDTDSEEESVLEATVNFRHLSHPDFLLLSSAPPGYFSFRNEHGSWFVQELCKVFTSHGKEKDFLQMFTEANRQVAKRVSNTPIAAKHNKKQTLCLTSTLTRNLDFRSFN